MPGRVLAISYKTEHGALYHASLEYCDLLRLSGYDANVFDAAAPGGIEELFRRLKTEEYEFCFGLQGVGSLLAIRGNNIWTERRTPFIGIHYDNPCYNIYSHSSTSPYVANLYCFESFREIHNKYIQTPQIVDHLSYEIFTPSETTLNFRERPIKLLFIKIGARLDECFNVIDGLAPRLRDGARHIIERLQRDPNLLVCDLVQELFNNLGIERMPAFDLFWGIAHWVDFYIRRKRAIDFVDWLKLQEGAVIIGDGWDFIDKNDARAMFMPSIEGVEAWKLYGQTQFLCNVTPYGRDLIHERAVYGLFGGCHVISDANAWWEQNFRDVPAITLFDWNCPLNEQLMPVLDNPTVADTAHCGRGAALYKFTNKGRLEKILSTVDKVRQFAEKNAA